MSRQRSNQLSYGPAICNGAKYTDSGVFGQPLLSGFVFSQGGFKGFAQGAPAVNDQCSED